MRSNAFWWMHRTLGALAVASIVACGGAPDGDEESAATATSAEALRGARWWTCTARARVAPGVWENVTGYGPDYSAARANTLARCSAEGCYITGCHPGI